MSTDFTIGGDPEWSAESYSLVEDATPIDPTDVSGGRGQLTFDAPLRAHPRRMRGKTVRLADDEWGATSAVVREVAGDGGGVTVTADSRLSKLSVKRKVNPFTGTLGNLIRYYLGRCGITDGIIIDAALESRSVIAPGFDDVIWDALKELAVAEEFEITLLDANVVFRTLRQRVLASTDDKSASWDMDASQMAEMAEVFWTSGSWRTAGLAYPVGGWSEDVTVYQVGAGEVLTVELKLDIDGDDEGAGASLISIQQPVAVDTVSKTYSAKSVYTVAGNDGLPLKAKQWTDGGGKITVKLLDANTLELKITGSRSAQYAPYSIAMSAGPSNQYSSLRLVGEGYFYTRRRLETITGAHPDLAAQEMAPAVINRFLTNYTKAERALLAASQRYGTPRLTLDVAAGNVHWDPPTKASVGDQVFGNVTGARREFDGMNFRIDSATTSPAGVAYKGSADHILRDLNDIWAGKTLAEINAVWGGLTLGQINAELLMRPES